MKHVTLSLLAFAGLGISTLACHGEEAYNPHTNMQIPGLDMEQLLKANEQEQQRKSRLAEQRSAISQKIADEELARAKREVPPGSDPYAIADMRTRDRLQPYVAQWEKQDAASRNDYFGKNEADIKQMYNNQNYEEMARQQMELMKQLGISPPQPGR